MFGFYYLGVNQELGQFHELQIEKGWSEFWGECSIKQAKLERIFRA